MGGQVGGRASSLSPRLHVSLLTISSLFFPTPPPRHPPLTPSVFFVPFALSPSAPAHTVSPGNVARVGTAVLHTPSPSRSQARLEQAKRERDEAEVAAAEQAEEKAVISQRVALLEAAIRSS